MKKEWKIAAALLAVLLLTSCAPFALSPDSTKNDYGKLIIPSLRSVKSPANVSETELYGIWSGGNGFAGRGFELKPNHRYSESVRTDLMSGPYTWYGRWELHGSQLILHPFQKTDRRESLQIALYKRTLTLLPDDSEWHVPGDGWTLEDCFFKITNH